MADLERHELRHPDGRRLWVYGRLLGRLPSAAPATDDRVPLHQRYDALTDTWIAISPARNTRPHTSSATASASVACPLCPGGPEIPFPYDAAVFENRWPALAPEPPAPPDPADPRQAPSLGRCEVVVYTPDHVGSLATLTPDELARVIAIWTDRTSAAWADPAMRFVLAFENRGEAVGATIGHPHGQLYGFDRLPPFIERRVAALARHRETTGTCLTCAVVEGDRAAPERTIEALDAWHVAVPFAPRWPFELHVRAARHGKRRLGDLDDAERRELAGLLRRCVLRYDGLFGFELPYMMAIIEAPADAPDHHLAVELWPVHRSARLTKVRASVETATGLFINDTLPEHGAAALRSVPAPARDEAPPVRVVPAGPERHPERDAGRPR